MKSAKVIISLLSTGTIFVTFIIIAFSAWLVSAAIDADNRDSSIRLTFFELSIVRDEYYLNRDESSRAAVRKKQGEFSDLLGPFVLQFKSRDEPGLVAKILSDNEALGAMLDRFLAFDDREGVMSATSSLLSERDQRLFSQILIRSYFVRDDLERLAKYQFGHFSSMMRNSSLLFGGSTLLALLFMTSITLLGLYSISKSILGLREGARELGAGNLAYRLSSGWIHELSEVALEVNAMAERLSGSFTSVANLEREIERRHLAENEVRKVNAELEDRIRNRTSQLDAANRELEAFAYSVSHDLKAPLRSIKGFTAILEEEYGKAFDPEGLRLLAIIKDSASGLEGLISDLLSLSKVGRIVLVPEHIDMKALALTAWADIADEEERSAITLVVAELPPAEGDPILLGQVWRNLLSNAAKYTSHSDSRVVRIEAMENDTDTIYSVADSGAGFDMAHADKLFKVFQRLHTAQEFEGSGVGLAIVKRIIERHGGRVGAEGWVGEGARFWFSFPRDKPSGIYDFPSNFPRMIERTNSTLIGGAENAQ